ncbi:MAG: O-antigen ligase family protein [Planctomycetota bacterium]
MSRRRGSASASPSAPSPVSQPIARPASPFRATSWLERVARGVAPATIAAVVVALPLVPSEAVASGSTILLTLTLLIGLVTWAATRLITQAGWPVPRGSAVDAVLGLFFVLFTGSAARMIDSAHGRPAINVTWAWLGGGALWFLTRQSFRTPRSLRAMAAVLCAIATGLACYSYFPCGYQLPRDRAAFRRDPEAVLREAGVVAPEGSPIREQFRNRVESREPIATFALTNSLAGYLLPPLVLCLAGFAVSRRSGGKGSHEATRVAIVWAVAAVAIAGCLLLTKSRSGYVATLFAVGVLGWNVLRGGERIGWKIPIATLGVVAALAGLAVTTGFLDIQVLSEARMSLGYRWEYWTSTAALIRDFPLSGCGAGNFQSYYTAYKLPQASEVVADPHNFLFELAAIAGLPALAAWLAAFLLWLLAVVRRSPRVRAAVEVVPDESDSTTAIWIGAVCGLPLAAIAGILAGFPLSAAMLVTGVPPAIAIMVWLRPWVNNGEIPPFAWSVATLAVLVNFLAAGGIGFPAVATGWWLLGALALNAAETTQEQKQERTEAPNANSTVSTANNAAPVREVTPAPRWFWGLITASVILLTVAFHLTCYQPVFVSQSRLANATDAGERDDARTMFAELRAAADADPWSSAAWLQLASLNHRQWLEGGSSARDEFEQAVLEALKRDRRSHSLRREMGDLFFEAFGKTGDRAALGDAVALYRDACSLYPNHAPHHAQLAYALRVAGDQAASGVAAREALRLDQLNPHGEQKLDAQRIATFEPVSSTGPKPLNAREWVELIVRENPESN